MSLSKFRLPDVRKTIVKLVASYLGAASFPLAFVSTSFGQMQLVPQITTVVGTGTAGYSGDGGQASGAKLSSPEYLTIDAAGNLYISDTGNNVVRRVDANTSVITTIAGNGTAGYSGDGGPATSAQLNVPNQVAVDPNGNVYIADHNNSCIRMVSATTGIITTVANNATAGISLPNGVAVDSSGNLYVANTNKNTILKIAAGSGTVTTIAGTGIAGTSGDGGPATSAQLNRPGTLAFDPSGNLYIAFGAPLGSINIVRRINPAGTITTVAGTGVAGFSGDGGSAVSAQLNSAMGVATDPAANFYIVDSHNNRIRKVANGIITTIAGNGTPGDIGDNGPATNAELANPYGAISDSSGNLYIADSGNSVIRKLTPSAIPLFPSTNVGAASSSQTIYLQATTAETISSITVPQSQGGKQEYTIGAITGCTVDGTTINPAGTVCAVPITFTPAYPGRRWAPLQAATSTGNINFGLQGIGVGPLAVLTPGTISTVAGSGTVGYSGDGGAAVSAKLNNPYSIAVDNAGNFYIADFNNGSIRKVTTATGIITTYAGTGVSGYGGDGGPATSGQFTPPRIALDSAGNLYIADYYNNRIRKVNAATGVVTTIAGTGALGSSGDGGAATSALLYRPAAIAIDDVGNLYIAEDNTRVRKVTAGTGIITTVAGTGVLGYSGDGGLATSARVNRPAGLAIDNAENVYFAEVGNNAVRKITVATGIITTVAGGQGAGFSGDGGLATSAKLNTPNAVSFDNAGNLYIADTANNRVRIVAATSGMITTIVGNGTAGYAGDNGVATAAKLNFPVLAAPDGVGNLYIADSRNNVIRKINVSQSALTYPTATVVGTSDSTDNPQSVLLSNIGNDVLPILPPSSGSNPSVSANFALNSSTSCPQLSSSSSAQTLASGANCTIAIDFKPLQAGAITGSAVQTDSSLNVPGSIQTIQLTATGVAAATTTTVTSSVNPSAYGQSVTFTATVAPTQGTALPTGAVQFSVDGTPAGASSTLTNGVATYATVSLSVGTHTVTAVYTPSTSDFTGSTGSLMQTVTAASTTTTVTSSLNPSPFMQNVMFTATVAQTTGTTQPTGSVQFSADGTPVGSPVTLSGGVATCTISTLAVGLHTITAAYTPFPTNFTASSGSLGQRVGAVASSTTTLTVVPTTVMYGNTATLTAVVAPGFATGTVSFYEGTTLLGTASLDGTATAVLPINTLGAGVHTIVAKYNGDPGVPASTSNPAQLTVTKRTAAGGGPAITVTVNDASRTTTQSNPPFTYSAAGQLVNGDTYATAINGTPSYATAAGTSAGTFSITVSGLDSANYTIGFVPGTLTVTITPTTTTLVAAPSSTQYGDPVALNATVTSGATGTVSFYDGSVLLGTANVSNGAATLTTTTLVAGTHSITAVYNGDATYASSQSSPATVTVAKKQGAGGGAALTITVQNASREYNTSDPQFAYLVTGTLVNGDTYASAVTGTAVYSSTDTPTSPAGSTFPISVSGLSSANYEITVVNGTLAIVNAPTATTLTTSTVAAQYGDPVTLTATVAPNGATGTVLFMNGSTVLGTGTVTSGVAPLTTSSLNAGTYTVTAFYQGDGNYSASTSGPVTLTINPRTAPGGGAALTITVQDASRVYGAGNPAFTYTASGSLVNGDTVASAIAGVPVFATSAVPLSPVGSYPISVSGLNAANYVVAFVNGTLTVNKATTNTNVTLTSTPDPPVPNQPVTFTATVPPGATGTITFMDGGVVLGTATITNGVATLTTTLPSGTHSVTAVYNGDANHTGTTSNVATVIVGQASALDFTLTLTSAGSQSVMPGDAAPYKVQVAPTNVTYPGTVTFSAAGLPPGATISFTPATVAANAGPTPSNVSIQTAPQKAALNQNRLDSSLGSAVLALLMLPFATARRIRKSARRPLFVIMVLLGGLAATTGLTGCGYNGNGFFGQAPKTYNITLTATSGTIQHSVNVTLEVQ